MYIAYCTLRQTLDRFEGTRWFIFHITNGYLREGSIVTYPCSLDREIDESIHALNKGKKFMRSRKVKLEIERLR